MQGTPAALVFDFDGLILDTEAAEHASVSAIFSEFGATLSLHQWTSGMGTAQPDGYWLDWLEADLGRPVNRELLWIEQQQRNHYLIDRLSVLPGVHTLIDAALANNVPCAVASSSPSRWVVPKLDRLGLLDSFTTVVTREDASVAKPAPDLYLEALRRLDVGAAVSTTAIAFEDSRNGSLAAVAAGMTCVVCPNPLTADLDLSHAHHRVGSLAELDWAALTSLVAPQLVSPQLASPQLVSPQLISRSK
jgi:putative hydrolase of the HAD superfamily